MATATTLDLDPSLELRVRKIAVLDSDVLITGPTGSGKSAVAQRIHELSGRSGRLVSQNCAAIPAELAEGILFGHERGAFTGADRDRDGIIVQAHNGTLFLDEVGELPLPIQAKLLTVLQEREVQPLGAAKARPSRFRLIAATHRDLLDRCNKGLFREDLYHRLNSGLPIELPPLRESPEQAERIAALEAARTRLGPEQLAQLRSAVKRLTNHPAAWPGNIRELLGFVRRCQLGVGEAERWKCDEWARWRPQDGTERLTPFAPSVSPSLADRERFAGLIQEVAGGGGGGARPKSAFSRKGSMDLASRLLDAYPTPLSTDDVQTILDARQLRTVQKNIDELVKHGLVRREGDGIVAVWPPARSTLFVYRQGEWAPVGAGEIPSLTRGDRVRIEVTSRWAGVLGIAMITHPAAGPPAKGFVVRDLALSASKPARVDIELDASGGIEQMLVHLCPARRRGGHLVASSQAENVAPDSAALEQGRRWVLEQWKEGWLHEHLVFHSQRK
jgi:hypothetical protein